MDDDVELVDVDELVLDEVEELVVLEELEVEDEEVDEEMDEVLVGPADVVELPVGTAELETDILQKALQGDSITI